MAEVPFSIIKFEGDQSNNVLVHKSEITDFNYGSILIVNESQTALLYKDGIAEGPFPAGRHVITTNNIPTFREKFARFFSRGIEKVGKRETPFACEVFFINMVADLPVLWGTPNPLQLEDPKYHLILNVGARGNTRLRVIDPMRFVVKVCGQIKDYTMDRLKGAIKADLLPIVSSLISQTINRGQISILEINDNLLELSDTVLEKLNYRLGDLGLEALHFNIENIEAQDSDLLKLRQAKEKYLTAMTDIDIEAARTTRLAAARAEARRQEGTTYREEKQFDILARAAENEGASSNVVGATMGIGIGAGLVGGIAPAFNQLANSAMAENICKKCGGAIPANSKFCPNCGEPIAPPAAVCGKCGGQIPQGSKFCPNCGAPVIAFCPNCGTEVPQDSKFCPSCGNPLESAFRGK